MKNLTFELVTNKIIATLERGVVPWRKPWSTGYQAPINAISQRQYRGVNTLLLGMEPFEDNRWLTFHQARELGGSVKAGEKGSMVVFWKQWEREEDEDGEEPTRTVIPILRYFNVFNAEQCENLPLPPLARIPTLSDEDRITRAEALVTAMPKPPFIEESGDQAWYLADRDLIRIPPLSRFHTIDGYYSTLFHELVHSTGHPSRLNRKFVRERLHFGSEGYSREELVAELGSAFCCALVGIDNTITDNANYIASWLSVLRGDCREIVFAAAQAQKATDYIRGISYPGNLNNK
ncbi:MAG: DUF1738 domain-containing protein [Armatimonadetes bacterium]|nr:DUF1738 domain-containing protein [Armatimonadota bacterium]